MAPNLATVWGIWNQNISINQLQDTARMLCFAAKWIGNKETMYYSEFHDGRDKMLGKLWELLDEADAVIHYNGERFDIPHIQREFLEIDIIPPSPFKQIDLLKTIKKEFRFVSNKLDHVVGELSIGSKLKHEGHQLWLDCMDQKESAWAKMERYNKKDVILVEKLYKRVLPWIKNHPNHSLYQGADRVSCPNCGSHSVIKNGVEHLKTQSYQRYRCGKCGTNLRGRYTVVPTNKRKNILTQVK